MHIIKGHIIHRSCEACPGMLEAGACPGMLEAGVKPGMTGAVCDIDSYKKR